MTASGIGTPRNIQSCASAGACLGATPLERAGWTEVFATGMEIRWISVGQVAMTYRKAAAAMARQG